MAKSSLLTLGTYKIYETVPPQGYTLNEEPMTVTGDFDGQTVEVGRADAGISDRVIKGQVAVTKFADKPLTGDTEDSGIKLPLEGIEFTLTLKSTGEVACKIVTDADGYAITPMLPYGIYRIEETKGADGYRRIEPFDIVIDQNGKIYKYILENTVYETDVKIIKKDAETGNVIPLAGTQFKIKDSEGNWVKQKYNYPVPTEIDTFETAQDGTLVLPEPLRYGSYELHEVEAPDGYTLSKEPIPFTVTSENPSTMLEVVCSNQPVKGTVTIEKLGECFTGADFGMTEYGKLFTPIYELKGLEGISFDIIASEDIATPDGTVRYEAGTVVDTITTGADGKATSKPLYLGKYQAVEKNTEDGFVLDTQKHPFELTYKDQHTEIVTASMKVENQRQKAKVSLVKEFEALCNQTYSPLSSVVFGVYAKEDILTADGEIGIEKGSLVDVFAVDEMGNGVMNTDIPAGSYFVKELANDKTESYVLPADQLITVQHGETAQVKIENKKIRGNVEITKKSDDGKLLTGVVFGIFTEDGDKVLEITTDTDGKALAKELEYGDYYLQELKTIDGYKLNDKKFSFSVKENGETIQIEVINDTIREVPPTKTDTPKTGNNTNVGMFMGLLALSGAGLTGAYLYKRRKMKKS